MKVKKKVEVEITVSDAIHVIEQAGPLDLIYVLRAAAGHLTPEGLDRVCAFVGPTCGSPEDTFLRAVAKFVDDCATFEAQVKKPYPQRLQPPEKKQ